MRGSLVGIERLYDMQQPNCSATTIGKRYGRFERRFSASLKVMPDQNAVYLCHIGLLASVSFTLR